MILLCYQETRHATSIVMEFFKNFTGLSNLLDPGSLGIMFVKVKIDAFRVMTTYVHHIIPTATDNDWMGFCYFSAYANHQNQVVSFFSLQPSHNCLDAMHLYE